MENDNDWYNVLDSVLFTCHITTHSSTGVSPYRMVYNKDPILPFEYKDKLDLYSDEVFGLQKSFNCPLMCVLMQTALILTKNFHKLLRQWKSKSRRYFLMLKPK